jgi:antagonist of KipI
MMRIRIIKPGILSTIQDLGRKLYLSQAVPVSGAMDTLSARIANMAIGNDDNAAVIEFTYADAEFMTETDALIAYAGDGTILQVGELVIPAEKPVFIPAYTSIQLINNPAGSRTYLAIAGGFDVPEVLGSRSTFITAKTGGFEGRSLQAGDTLYSAETLTTTTVNIFEKLKGQTITYPAWSIARRMFLPADTKRIRIVPAHEFSWFHGLAIVNFLSEPYTLSMNSNRMGYHLDGEPITRIIKNELLSTAVTPGTIQVTGNGSMVLLMADCQTTGGYPRIAQVAAVDLPLCGQLKPGDAIYFEDISHQNAEMLYIEREHELQQIRQAIQQKYL